LQALKQRLWRRPPLPEEQEDFTRIETAIDEAIQSAQSQKTIDESGVLSLAQRIEGIQAILHEYAKAFALLEEYRALAPDLLLGDSEVPVGTTILGLEQESRIALAKLLREQARDPAVGRVRAPGSGQRLIRDSEALSVGPGARAHSRCHRRHRRCHQPDRPQSRRQLASAARLRRRFEAVTEAGVAVPRPTRSLENLKGDAPGCWPEPIVQQQARDEALGSSLPASVEARLTRQSDAIKAVAEKVAKHCRPRRIPPPRRCSMSWSRPAAVTWSRGGYCASTCSSACRPKRTGLPGSRPRARCRSCASKGGSPQAG
jgi:hypothetical protein